MVHTGLIECCRSGLATVALTRAVIRGMDPAGYQVASFAHVPPLFEANNSIVVGVYLRKEAVKVLIGDRESSAAQRRAQFFSRNLSVAVVIDTAKERQKLFLGLVNEGAKF